MESFLSFISSLYEIIMNVVESSSIWGTLFACFLIFIESILPVLPLFVFITIVFLSFGPFFGFIVSWLFTVLGCYFSFWLVRKFSSRFVKKRDTKINELIKKLKKISLPQLVILIAIPFTPAFMVNIAAAFSNMSTKKFMTAILIGKISLVAFWGFIGTSLIESLKNPTIMIQIVILVLSAYILSLFVSKKMEIR